MFEVRLTPAAAEQFDDLPRPIRRRVQAIFERLRRWPAVSGVKALSGSLGGRFRVRTGDYRVQFRIAGQTVRVEKIGHRDGFYGE